MTTPPDAHGADDQPRDPSQGPSGAVPFPDTPGSGAVPFSTPPSGAVPFPDPPGTGALPFTDLPEMDAAPPPGRPGTGAAPFPSSSWPAPGPPNQGAPPVGGPQPPEEPARTSGLAVTALVTGLVGLVPLALGFGIAALVHRRRKTRTGKSFAIVGIAAAAAWSAAVSVLLPVAVETVFTPERDASGSISESGTTAFSALRKGDCFTDYDSTERLRLVRAVPCAEPHTGEVVMHTALPDGPWPGEDRAQRAAHVVCGREIGRLRKSPLYPALKPYTEVPNNVGWKTGRRKTICAVHHDDERKGGLADTVNTELRTYEELSRWRCIKGWAQEKHPLVSPVSCSRPHFAQVFATYEFQPGLEDDPLSYPPYPDRKALEQQVMSQCEAHAVKTWPRLPRPDLQLFVVPPHPYDWEIGIRTVVCMVNVPGERLRGSLAPR
ncbi:septum formation family protein [Spirillospora sp. NPDC052242]